MSESKHLAIQERSEQEEVQGLNGLVVEEEQDVTNSQAEETK